MSTQMKDPRDLFLHERRCAVRGADACEDPPQAAGEAADDGLAQGFEEHLEETRQHVKNLEQAFAKLDEPAKAEKCPGIEGIRRSTTSSSQTSRLPRRSSTRSSQALARAQSTTRSPPTKDSSRWPRQCRRTRLRGC